MKEFYGKSQEANKKAITALRAKKEIFNQVSNKKVLTGDKIYTDDEIEFIFAIRKYIEITGNKFPTFSDIFKVMKTLGYKK